MRALRFDVNRQLVRAAPDCDFSGIVPGSMGYLVAQFSFDDEWSGCKKAASFYGVNGIEEARPIVNGVCEIPAQVLDGRFFEVCVTGIREGFRIRTNKMIVRQEG